MELNAALFACQIINMYGELIMEKTQHKVNEGVCFPATRSFTRRVGLVINDSCIILRFIFSTAFSTSSWLLRVMTV